MAWIESHQSLKDHPKTLKLSALMGWEVDYAIGKLHRFWWWCLDYAPDGDLRKFNDAQIALGVGVAISDSSKFVKAMKESCWIDSEPYFRVHDWWDYCGTFLKTKWRHSEEKWKHVQQCYASSKTVSNTPSKNANQPTNQPTGGAPPVNDIPGKFIPLDLTRLDPNKNGDHMRVEKRLEIINERIGEIKASKDAPSSPMRDSEMKLLPEWRQHLQELKNEAKHLKDWLTGVPSPNP